MKSFTFWRHDDPSAHDAYEALLERLGGEPLATQREQVRAIHRRLQATLTPEQRDLYLDCADASIDASALREDAAVQAAVTLGVGLGAALAQCPDEPVHTVLDTAAGVVCAVLGSGLSPAGASDAARAALDALARLPADRPHTDG